MVKSTPTSSSQNESVMAELDENARDKEKSLGKNSKTEVGENMKTHIHKPCSQGKQDTSTAVTTTEYCEKLQEWMWQYYHSYMNWQSWVAMSAFSFPPCFPTQGTNETPGATTWGADMSNGDLRNWFSSPFGFPAAAASVAAPAAEANPRAPVSAAAQLPQQQLQQQQQQQPNGNAQQPGNNIQ